MCGICGKISLDLERPVEERLIHDMATLIAHRGPDDEGFYVKGPIGLGHRRLSIIDVAGGHQPIANEDGSKWIIFNGEIYNHRELRKELSAKGHQFKTNTDTEAILHAYEEYGLDCPQKLNGMFAFAIWDERERSLFLARDRFGIKPLYYRIDNGALAFASEVKALLVDPECDETLNEEAIFDYFSSFVFDTKTMFKAIHRLAPAHSLLLKNGTPYIERYWQPEIDIEVARQSEEENLRYLEHLFRSVTEEHLMSEVPQGAFLSGGVDSSLTTIQMSTLLDEPVNTFCIGFAGHGDFDESRYAQQVADRFQTNHHLYQCTPYHVDLLDKVLWHLEEPLADGPTIALMLLAQESRKHVSVVQCGDGGDEAFAGYVRYYADQYADAYNQIPEGLRSGLALPFFKALRHAPNPLRKFGRRAEKFSRSSELPRAARYLDAFANVPGAVKEQMLHPDFLSRMGDYRSTSVVEKLFAEAQSLNLDPVAALQYQDLYNFSAHSLMLKGDKIPMSVGLEGRYPWLDHRIVNFGLSLPRAQKIRCLKTKIPPRKLLEKHMPRDFTWRGKQGFALPIEEWFKDSLQSNLNEIIQRQESDDAPRLNKPFLKELLQNLHAGDPHVWPYLWTVYVYDKWTHIFEHPREKCLEAIKRTTDPLARQRAEASS
jgi:asparagine synthase (glutamine-hydrolysing)